jgi:hypothetical protein
MTDLDRLLRESLSGIGDRHIQEHEAKTPELRRALARRVRRRRLAVAGAAVVAGCALVAGAIWTPSLVRTEERRSAASPHVNMSATIDVGNQPDSIAVGEGAVWVGRRSGELVRIDPATNEVVAKIDVGSSIVDVAAGEGAVYVAGSPHGRLIQWISGIAADRIFRIDPATNEVTGTWEVEPSQMRLAVNEQGVWFLANTNGGDDGQVQLLDPGTGDITRLEGTASSLVATPGGIWFTTMSDGAYAVGRFGAPFNDPGDRILTSGLIHEVGAGGDGTVAECADCPPPPSGIAAIDDAVVAGWNGRGAIAIVDPRFSEDEHLHDDNVEVPGSPAPSVAIGGGSVWAVAGGDRVIRIDLESGRIVGDPIEVGRVPYDIAGGYDSVWVANVEGGTVTRIDPGAQPPPVAEESPTPAESPPEEAPKQDEAPVTGEGFGMWPVHTPAEYRKKCVEPSATTRGPMLWSDESAGQVAERFGRTMLGWQRAFGNKEGALLDDLGTVRVALFPFPTHGPATRGVVDVYLVKPGPCWLIAGVSRPGTEGEVDVSAVEGAAHFDFEIPNAADAATVSISYGDLARDYSGVTEQELPVEVPVQDVRGPGRYLVVFFRNGRVVGAEGRALPPAR